MTDTENYVRLSILSHAFGAIAEEMGANLVRSSFSSVIREARDCSTAVMSPDGEVVAVAALIPMQTLALSVAFQHVKRVIDLSLLGKKAAILLNDPSYGGQHLNDIIIIQPVFHGETLIGFVGSTAHHIDIGGATAGVNVEARELIQEGIVIPPLLIDVERDWHGGMIPRFLTANVRMADVVIGDINAQFAANRTGIKRLLAMSQRYGAVEVLNAMSFLLDSGERRMRTALQALPSGVFTGSAITDGTEDEAVRVQVTATVGEGSIAFDFSGSSRQLSNMMNCPLASSQAAVMSALRCLISDKGLPVNDGCSRPVVAVFPYGSVINPGPGAPVRARAAVAYRVFDAIHTAFADVMPERVPAEAFNSTFAMYLTQGSKHGMKVHVDIFGGGFGACRDYDGANAVDCIMSNCRATPVEAIEFAHPHLLVRSFALEIDSGGAGRWRGGLGFHRRIEVLENGLTLSWYGDRFLQRPSGREGGLSGHSGAMLVHRGSEIIQMASYGRFAAFPFVPEMWSRCAWAAGRAGAIRACAVPRRYLPIFQTDTSARRQRATSTKSKILLPFRGTNPHHDLIMHPIRISVASR
jgi:N-methylhydantoinase B